jgi:hypothetical protein
MVEELIGNEEVMLAIARANGNISEEEAALLVEERKEDTASIRTEEDLKRQNEGDGDEEDEDEDYRRYKEYMEQKAKE